MFGKGRDNTGWGCCSLDAGNVPHRYCVQQIANRLFLDVLFQASATTGKRIPLYLAVHEARTPMFLMRHGCRLTHFLISYISIVVPTTARTPTPFHCKCMHTVRGSGMGRELVCARNPFTGNAFRLESRRAPQQGDWTAGCCQVGSVSQSARTSSLSSAFSSSQTAARCPSFSSTDFSSCTPSHRKSIANCSHQHNTLAPNTVLPQQCLPRNHMQS